MNEDFLDILRALHRAGREALLANKRAVGRLQDLADVEALSRLAIGGAPRPR